MIIFKNKKHVFSTPLKDIITATARAFKIQVSKFMPYLCYFNLTKQRVLHYNNPNLT